MQNLTNARIMEIIELLVAILKEAVLTEEQRAVIDKVMEELQ